MQNLTVWQEYKENQFQVRKEEGKLTSRDVITKLPLHHVSSGKVFFSVKTWEFFYWKWKKKNMPYHFVKTNIH